MADLIDSVRSAVSDRAELPGMSLMEHLGELRKRLIHSVVYLLVGFCVAYAFHERLYGIVQAPLDKLGIALNYTHPTDALNLYIKTALYGGFILASPFILYQLWLFISPGMYSNEKRYVVPFMGTTILLFLGGAWFGYHYVFPGALNILINGFGKKFHAMLTIDDYTGFFLAIVLGLGVTFELPIVMFFLALFGIVDAKFLMRHIRYAILIIFIVAGIICPMPDPLSMCIFAAPMLILYMLGVLAAFIVHPARRKARKAKNCMTRMTRRSVVLPSQIAAALVAWIICTLPAPAQKTTPKFSGEAAYNLTRQLLQVAPKRFNGSPGHAKAEEFIKDHFKPEAAKGNFEIDTFTAGTPAGFQTMHNFIVKYPGKKDGIIVIASHYETNYPLRDIAFFGANDGAATTALLIEIGDVLRVHPPEGYSVWLVFDDGEEAVNSWSASDSLYGTRHLAAKWSQNGTISKIKAFLVADMIADKDLNIDHDDNSTPWLLDLLKVAAKNTGHSAYIFKYHEAEEDDQLPFVQRGVPALDMIDAHYGPSTNAAPDGYHHTAEDTLDKISAHSLQISGDVILEMVRLIDQRP